MHGRHACRGKGPESEEFENHLEPLAFGFLVTPLASPLQCHLAAASHRTRVEGLGGSELNLTGNYCEETSIRSLHIDITMLTAVVNASSNLIVMLGRYSLSFPLGEISSGALERGIHSPIERTPQKYGVHRMDILRMRDVFGRIAECH